MKNPKVLARVAGLLYLAVAVFGSWAQLVARSAVHVPGDATATTDNLVQNSGLFRAGLVADMLMATVFVFLGLALYRLFYDASARLATILMVFVSVSAGSILVNLIFHFGALLVATDPGYLAAFGADARDGLVLLLVELHQYGYSLGGVFFGLWLLPVGIVGYRSGLFPRWFAVIVIVGSLVWLLDPFVVFAAPETPEFVRAAISAITAVAEFGLILFLLIVGVLRPKTAAVAA
jgi:hypothetical protein